MCELNTRVYQVYGRWYERACCHMHQVLLAVRKRRTSEDSISTYRYLVYSMHNTSTMRQSSADIPFVFSFFLAFRGRPKSLSLSARITLSRRTIPKTNETSLQSAGVNTTKGKPICTNTAAQQSLSTRHQSRYCCCCCRRLSARLIHLSAAVGFFRAVERMTTSHVQQNKSPSNSK